MTDLKPVVLVTALLAVALSSCGSSGGGCDLPAGNWSVASSGMSCQVNIYGDTEYAAYCSQTQEGDYACACGAAVDNPLEFNSPDICDLDGEERACEAVARCGWPL